MGNNTDYDTIGYDVIIHVLQLSSNTQSKTNQGVGRERSSLHL